MTEKLMKQIYDLSAGIPAYIVKLFEEAQVQAILSGTETLSYACFRQAADYLGMEVPKVFGRGGTSISDFSVEEVEMEELSGSMEETGNHMELPTSGMSVREEMRDTVLPDKTLRTIPTGEIQMAEPETCEEPVKRFYATKRGRKKADRDETDLLVLLNEGYSCEAVFQTLEGWDMAERRCF